MKDGAYLEVKLHLDDPVEISDFAALFAGLGSEFERYLSDEHPEMHGSARMYVQEVRKGSVVATLFAQIPDMIGMMDSVVVVLTFGALFNKRIRGFITGNSLPKATKPQLNDILRTIRALAQDAQGTMTLKGIRHTQGLFTTDFEATFTASEARAAARTIEHQKLELDRVTTADHKRVLMTFTRSDVGNASVGKRSGERVVVPEISERPLSLIYGSDLAEAQIKHEIQNSQDNIFKRGFIVDLNVVFAGARAVAYSVTHLHSVIDLPDDDEPKQIPLR